MLVNESMPLIFKTFEASRYGSFSSKKDVLILANRLKEDAFLEKLSQITGDKIRFMFEYLNKKNNNDNQNKTTK